MKTDQQLTRDVQDELLWEPAVQAGQIQVQCVASVVRLTGELPSTAQCWSAERAARRVAGVRGLDLRLTVRLPAAGRCTDSDIAHAARNVLAWLVEPPVQTVQVVVRDGCVTLTGQLPWPWQKPAILAALHLLPGVQGLTDAMQDGPVPAPAQPPAPDARPIEAAIRRRLPGPAMRVRVLVEGTGVTLSGQVCSRAERELANHAAWGTPGVRAVHDRLLLVR